MIVVYTQVIHGIISDDFQLLRLRLPDNAVIGKNLHQLSRELALYSRVQKSIVLENLGKMGSCHILRALRARVSRGQVDDNANPAILDACLVTILVVSLHALGRSQINIVDNLHGSLAVHLQWIVELVEIAALRNNHRLVEGNPVLYPVAEKLIALPGEDNKQIHYLLGLPAAVLVQELHRYIEMNQVHDGADALCDELVNNLIVKTHCVSIHLAGLKILNQAGPLNGSAHGIKPYLLHEVNILTEAVVKIGCHVRAYLVKKGIRVSIIPIIKNVAMCLVETAFGLWAGSSRPPPKILWKLVLHKNPSSL